MVKRIGGFRRKTRHKLRRNIRERGKLSLKAFFQELKEGDKIILKANPSYQKGMYFPRFHGKPGVICKKQGNCYYIKIKDGNKDKQLLVHPIHLKKL